MIGSREGLCGVSDAVKRGAREPGADACLEDGGEVEVSVPGLEEEVFQGLVSSRGLSRGLLLYSNSYKLDYLQYYTLPGHIQSQVK